MDSSDGLSTTLNEMANQSKCKFIINNIPTGKDLLEFAKLHKIDPNDLVFHGGEEYEFVFTASKKYKSLIKKNASILKTPIIEIGYVTKGKGVFLEKQEKFIPLKDLGWHHFRK
jgi:thiamine-monophosphate kinase